MNQLVTIDDVVVRVDAHGRYCLNDLHKAAIANGKATDSHKPSEFLSNQGVQGFIDALDASDAENISKAGNPASVKSIKGGKSPGTYAVEIVAIRYAAWIDPAFEVRVYRTFQKAVKKNDNWRVSRHASASGFKVAADILKMVRDEAGKDTKPYHYSNEARLINWAMTDKFDGIDRNTLSADDLDMLAYLQERNAVLIGRGLDYEHRKPIIKQYAMDKRMTLALPAEQAVAHV